MAGFAEMTLLRYLHHLDKDITLCINACGGPGTDWFWQVCSDRFVWIPFYALVAFFLFKRLGWKKAAVCVLACVLTLVACDQLGNLVKHSVQRLRPCWDSGMLERGLRVLEAKGGQYGFFSSHAANTAGFAACTLKLFRMDSSHGYRVYGGIAFLWTALVGISRVFVGKHFLGDVLAGFAVGLVAGIVIAVLSKMIVRRFSL